MDEYQCDLCDHSFLGIMVSLSVQICFDKSSSTIPIFCTAGVITIHGDNFQFISHASAAREHEQKYYGIIFTQFFLIQYQLQFIFSGHVK